MCDSVSPLSGYAAVLLDDVLRGFEEADADGDLARAIRAERARFEIGSLEGRSFAEAWHERVLSNDVGVARSD